MKTGIKITTVCVCLILTGVILVWHWPQSAQGLDSIPETSTVWVKCRQCDYKNEVTERGFIQQQRNAMEAARHTHASPQLACPQCQAAGVVVADKCIQCETVFIHRSDVNDYPDRCPHCGVSAMQTSRQAQVVDGDNP